MSLSSVKQSRNTLVPILLNEFPIPPTFIPQNLPPTSNPPPSRPPTLPLPPIPGPSPLTNQDLFHITAAARSRRASRISTSSNSSWRDSVASLGSGSSHGGPSSLTLTTSAVLLTLNFQVVTGPSLSPRYPPILHALFPRMARFPLLVPSTRITQDPLPYLCH
jgi:hypothetical protein